MDMVWLTPPFGAGEPMEVEATPEKIVPLMVAGYNQCAPPQTVNKEEMSNVHD
jgi:hypothetical protein